MNALLLAALACLPALAALWPELSSPSAEQRGGDNDAAVIVGVEKYPFVAPVPGAAQNADDWHLYLTKTRKVPVSQVRLLRDSEATLEDMKDAAAWAASAVKPGGTLWFVFIGHGAPHKDGADGVLIGVDAQQRAESLYNRSLRRSELMSILGKGRQERAVVVLDACFSGRTAEGKELVKGLQPLIALAAAGAWPKAAVFTAAKSDQFAGPLPGASRPAFSYLMLGALRGWADADKDGAVTADEALSYTQGSLGALLKDRRQTPELLGSLPGALSRGAREAGPDVGALVRAVRPKDGSELAFEGAAGMTAPVMRVVVAEGSFKDADISVEHLLEDAVLREKDAAYLPVEKMLAWCLLAGAPQDKHPYRAQAAQACASWQAFVEKAHEQQLNLLEDYAALRGYLELRLKTPEQKTAALDAFLKAYGPLKDEPAVAAATAAREALSAGKLETLPWMDEAGPLRRPKTVEVPETLRDAAFTGSAAGLEAEQTACRRDGGVACKRFFDLWYASYMPGDETVRRRAVALGLLVCMGGSVEGCAKAAEHYTDAGLPASETGAAVGFAHGCLVLGEPRSCYKAALAAAKVNKGMPPALAAGAELRGVLLIEARCLRGDAPSCVIAAPGHRQRVRLLLAKGCRQKDDASCAALADLQAHAQAREKEAALRAAEKREREALPARRAALEAACEKSESCRNDREFCARDARLCTAYAACWEVEGACGVPLSLPLAAEAYGKACDAGDAPGCASLAQLYEQGRGVPKDEARFAQLRERACELKHAGACASIAGSLPPSEAARALRLNRKACDLGSFPACSIAAYWLVEGRGGAEDRGAARRYARKACENSNGGAPACILAMDLGDASSRARVAQACDEGGGPTADECRRARSKSSRGER